MVYGLPDNLTCLAFTGRPQNASFHQPRLSPRNLQCGRQINSRMQPRKWIRFSCFRMFQFEDKPTDRLAALPQQRRQDWLNLYHDYAQFTGYRVPNACLIIQINIFPIKGTGLVNYIQYIFSFPNNRVCTTVKHTLEQPGMTIKSYCQPQCNSACIPFLW